MVLVKNVVLGCTLSAVFSLFAAGAPAMLMPVPALINGAATAHRVAFLPHHQVRCSGRNRAVAFGAGVGFLGVDGGNVLHQPVTVSVTFQSRCRVEDPADITPCGCLTVPLIAGGAGYSPAGMILTCHEPYSTALLSYLYLPTLPLFALRSSSFWHGTPPLCAAPPYCAVLPYCAPVPRPVPSSGSLAHTLTC